MAFSVSNILAPYLIFDFFQYILFWPRINCCNIVLAWNTVSIFAIHVHWKMHWHVLFFHFHWQILAGLLRIGLAVHHRTLDSHHRLVLDSVRDSDLLVDLRRCEVLVLTWAVLLLTGPLLTELTIRTGEPVSGLFNGFVHVIPNHIGSIVYSGCRSLINLGLLQSELFVYYCLTCYLIIIVYADCFGIP